MALDKVIDSAVLDAGLTSVADAIRAKGGTSEQLAFPDGFVSAVEAITAGGGSGTTAKGSFTLASTTRVLPEFVHNLGTKKVAVVIVPAHSETPIVSLAKRTTLYAVWINIPAFVSPQAYDFSAHNTIAESPYSVDFSQNIFIVRSSNNAVPLGEVASLNGVSGVDDVNITDNSVELNVGAYTFPAGDYEWYVGVIS